MNKNDMTSPAWTSRFVLSCSLTELIEQLQDELNMLDIIDLPVDHYDFDKTIDQISVIIGTLTHICKRIPQQELPSLEKRIFNMLRPYPLVRLLLYFRNKASKDARFRSVHVLTISELKHITTNSSYNDVVRSFINDKITKDKVISLLYQLTCVVRDIETSYSVSVTEGVIGMEVDEMVVLRNIYKCIHSLFPKEIDAGEYIATTFYDNHDVYDMDLSYIFSDVFDKATDDETLELEEELYGYFVAGAVNVMYEPDVASVTIDRTLKNILEFYKKYNPSPNVDEIRSEVSSYISTVLWRTIDYLICDYVYNSHDILNYSESQPNDVFKQIKLLALIVKVFVYIVETKGGRP